jgi:hypothetical protein
LKVLRLQVEQLQKEINKQREIILDWQKKYQQLLQKSNNVDLQTGAHIVVSYSLYDYLRKYLDYFFPFLQIHPPYLDLQPVIEKTGDPFKMLTMNVILSLGAFLHGNRAHADEFRNMARTMLANFFDVVHPQVLACHFLLSKAFAILGDCNKSTLFNGIAYSMAKIFVKKFQVTQIENFDLIHIIHLCRLSSAQISRDTSKLLSVVDEILNRFTLMQTQNGALSPQQFTCLALALLIKVGVEMTMNVERAQSQTSVQSTDMEPGSQAILSPAVAQKIFALIQQAQHYALLGNSVMRQTTELRIQTLIAWLNLITGQPTKALQVTESVSRALRQSSFIFPFSFLPLVTNAQIYLYLKEFSKFEADIELIRRFSQQFPLANFLLQQLFLLKEKYQQTLDEKKGQMDLMSFIQLRSQFFRYDSFLLSGYKAIQKNGEQPKEVDKNEIVPSHSQFVSQTHSSSPMSNVLTTKISNNANNNSNDNNMNSIVNVSATTSNINYNVDNATMPTVPTPTINANETEDNTQNRLRLLAEAQSLDDVGRSSELLTFLKDYSEEKQLEDGVTHRTTPHETLQLPALTTDGNPSLTSPASLSPFPMALRQQLTFSPTTMYITALDDLPFDLQF